MVDGAPPDGAHCPPTNCDGPTQQDLTPWATGSHESLPDPSALAPVQLELPKQKSVFGRQLEPAGGEHEHCVHWCGGGMPS
jgi:hypothetical protein